MSTLYDITNEYIDILNSCYDKEELSDEIAEKLENINESFEQKAKTQY